MADSLSWPPLSSRLAHPMGAPKPLRAALLAAAAPPPPPTLAAVWTAIFWSLRHQQPELWDALALATGPMKGVTGHVAMPVHAHAPSRPLTIHSCIKASELKTHLAVLLKNVKLTGNSCSSVLSFRCAKSAVDSPLRFRGQMGAAPSTHLEGLRFRV